MAKKCPKLGLDVCFYPNAAAAAFYSTHPRIGSCGNVTSVPLPGGRKTCMPGPRGGLVYVNWIAPHLPGGSHVEGVFRADLSYGRKTGKHKVGDSLGGAKRRRRKKGSR